MPYPTTDPIGMWVLKWIFVPFIVIGLIACAIHFEVMKHKGRELCEERGYIESIYIPPNRAGFGEQYVFSKKRNPDGTIDETARLIVPLD